MRSLTWSGSNYISALVRPLCLPRTHGQNQGPFSRISHVPDSDHCCHLNSNNVEQLEFVRAILRLFEREALLFVAHVTPGADEQNSLQDSISRHNVRAMKLLRRALRRWTGWNLPTRLGLTLTVLGMLLSFASWRWPEYWKHVVSERPSSQQSIVDSSPRSKAQRNIGALGGDAIVVIHQSTSGNHSAAVVSQGDVNIDDKPSSRPKD